MQRSHLHKNKKGEGKAVHNICANGEVCKKIKDKTHGIFIRKDEKRLYLIPVYDYKGTV